MQVPEQTTGDVIYSDLDIDPDTRYFLYVGELKSDCLNPLLRDFLSRKYETRFDFISILPDVLADYPHRNILVINPRSRKRAAECGKRVSCRLSTKEFYTRVSESETVHRLIRLLLERQKTVFVHVFESTPELTLPGIPGVVLLGPDGEAARRWNNKRCQLEALKNTDVPVIDFRICNGYNELVRTTTKLRPFWKNGIFVSQPYSAAGMNSFITLSDEDLGGNMMYPDSEYLVSRYIPHSSDPTVLGVAAGPGDVFIVAVADQEIEGGNKFRGSVFPSALSPDIQQELKRHTRSVGRMLGQSGYRGIYGCDFIVGENDQVHFVELNARKQGTTMEMACILEHLLPPGAPSLPELEFYAITEGRFPENAVELGDNLDNLCWRTYNYKTDREVLVRSFIPQACDERDLFRQVAGNSLEHGMIVMEHLGQGLTAEPGSFVGRIAAVSRHRKWLEADIRAGKELLLRSISTEK